jgi:hypothetical protein
MNYVAARSFNCRSIALLKEFSHRQRSQLRLHSLAQTSCYRVVPLIHHGTTAFRYNSTEEEFSAESDTTHAIAVNEEDGELLSTLLKVNEGDIDENGEETDFSNFASSSHDFSIGQVLTDGDDDVGSDSGNYDDDDDESRVDALNYPWLNGIEVSNTPAKAVPGPIKYFRTKKETFFQFDYRNIDRVPITRPEVEVLLQKIEVTLKDTELEPYGTSRGVETLRKNIDALPDGAKFRMGGGKGSLQKVGEGYDKAVYVTSHRALRKAMFNLLYERHAIITSGWTHDMKKLTSEMIGQSFLGPETRVVVDHKLGKDVIQELWMRGVSSKYNRLIKKHEDRFAERNFLRYLKPKSKEEAARMDWSTDLMLKSDEELARRKPTPTTRKRNKSC